MRLRDQNKGNDLDDEGPEVQTPAKRMRFRKQSNPTITVQHEVNHKMCQEVHRGQKLQWKKERLFCAKQLFASQTIVARVSIPIFENDEDQSGTDTSIRRDAVEVSNLRLTEQEAIEMNEAKEEIIDRVDSGGSYAQSSGRPRDATNTRHVSAVSVDEETIKRTPEGQTGESQSRGPGP